MTRSEQHAAMREFCRRVIQTYCWGDTREPDGGDLQDWAEELGLVYPTQATPKDLEAFPDFDVGDTIFYLSAWMQAPSPPDGIDGLRHIPSARSG